MSELDYQFQEGDTEHLQLHKGPFILTEKGLLFTPEFDQRVEVDSIIFDWLNTVEKMEVFGKTYDFYGAVFKPTISLMRVFGLERNVRDEQQNKLVEILSKDKPSILLIHGHGMQKEGKWYLSTAGNGEELVDIEKVLTGPVQIQLQKRSYDLLVIDACSNGANGVGNYEFPQSVVNDVGVPIYYIQGIASVLHHASRKLAEPTHKR